MTLREEIAEIITHMRAEEDSSAIADAILSKIQSELPRLDEEAVAEVIRQKEELSDWDCCCLSDDYPCDGTCDGCISAYAKAICSKFSLKVVRLPKEIDELELPKGWTIGEKQKYNQCLKDIKQSLEEQGIETKEILK